MKTFKLDKKLVTKIFEIADKYKRKMRANLGLLVSEKENGKIEEVKLLKRIFGRSCCQFPHIEGEEFARTLKKVYQKNKKIRGLVLIHYVKDKNDEHYHLPIDKYMLAVRNWGFNNDKFLILICTMYRELFGYSYTSGKYRKALVKYN